MRWLTGRLAGLLSLPRLRVQLACECGCGVIVAQPPMARRSVSGALAHLAQGELGDDAPERGQLERRQLVERAHLLCEQCRAQAAHQARQAEARLTLCPQPAELQQQLLQPRLERRTHAPRLRVRGGGGLHARGHYRSLGLHLGQAPSWACTSRLAPHVGRRTVRAAWRRARPSLSPPPPPRPTVGFAPTAPPGPRVAPGRGYAANEPEAPAPAAPGLAAPPLTSRYPLAAPTREPPSRPPRGPSRRGGAAEAPPPPRADAWLRTTGGAPPPPAPARTPARARLGQAR
eukprot:scaffold80443_cov63-Phaeocystis_antarctica.AAC.4